MQVIVQRFYVDRIIAGKHANPVAKVDVDGKKASPCPGTKISESAESEHKQQQHRIAWGKARVSGPLAEILHDPNSEEANASESAFTVSTVDGDVIETSATSGAGYSDPSGEAPEAVLSEVSRVLSSNAGCSISAEEGLKQGVLVSSCTGATNAPSQVSALPTDSSIRTDLASDESYSVASSSDSQRRTHKLDGCDQENPCWFEESGGMEEKWHLSAACPHANSQANTGEGLLAFGVADNAGQSHEKACSRKEVDGQLEEVKTRLNSVTSVTRLMEKVEDTLTPSCPSLATNEQDKSAHLTSLGPPTCAAYSSDRDDTNVSPLGPFHGIPDMRHLVDVGEIQCVIAPATSVACTPSIILQAQFPKVTDASHIYTSVFTHLQIMPIV